MATETTRINLTRDYETNGIKIPAGSHELPKDVADDLIRREQKYATYSKGIMEKHEYLSNAGTMAVGGGAE